jgi:hypothetical protein
MLTILKDAWEPTLHDPTPRAIYHERRIYQMNRAFNHLLERKPQLYEFSWGELMTGHLEDFDDPTHPGAAANVLYCNMILYYISKLR